MREPRGGGEESMSNPERNEPDFLNSPAPGGERSSARPGVLARWVGWVSVALFTVVWTMAAYLASVGAGADSDIVRQWVVCKYVVAGVNPYVLSKSILIDQYGVRNEKGAKIHAIPKDVPEHLQSSVIAAYGPPESTYPPSAIGLLSPLLGPLGEPRQVLHAWFAVNLVALGAVVVGLSRLLPLPPKTGAAIDVRILILVCLLLFPPTFSTFERGQFSLLALAALLLASDPSKDWLTRGAALGLALVKPSIALPFVFIPLARREWRVFGIAVVIQAAAAAYVMIQTKSVVGIFLDWLTVAQFFMFGMYTAHDWLTAAASISPLVVPLGSLTLLAVCGIVLFAGSRQSIQHQFLFACATAYFWTYHSTYDFIVLAPILLRYLGFSLPPNIRSWSALGTVVFAFVCLALTNHVIRGDDPLTHAIRWINRFVFLGLYVREFLVFHRTGVTADEETRARPIPPIPTPA